MTKATPKSLEEGFGTLTFIGNRTPESQDINDAFCQLSAYRDGAIFLGHWAGQSAWERHPQGDEVVMVVEGSTTLTLRTAEQEISHVLQAGQLIVVPQGTWHRFDTPKAVKLMTVTPQPTDHSLDVPT